MHIEEIINRFSEFGFEPDARQAEQFADYCRLLAEWNEKFNLTAITEPGQVITKHFIDSILGSKYLSSIDASIIDVGSGAGFPGIPLKIMYPELNVTLLDSLNKRVNFLNTVISELELKNIVAVHGRAEELGRKPEFRGQFEHAVSRAVAALPSLLEICVPFVKTGGSFIAYKSQKGTDELVSSANALSQLNCRVSYHEEVFADNIRSFVIAEKLSDTPAKFPRAGGKPFSKPL